MMMPAEKNNGILSFGSSVRTGWLVIFLFFGLLVGWATFSELSSAAIAPGEIAVDSSRKTIQHLEGGIVKEIFVAQGYKVNVHQRGKSAMEN